ncbi:Hydantoinase/oxoprolinase [Desulfofarcimen acetoxidans DSM 771]|uniref:Hydantoinase/oxoprolinase n=1 Tax=Desulfofarcimen acetoxidans (strain ATCC 49208 / DSM 771 / KCTC 5769 / VKM B-1644 / 5575) TaxID=485916 RepID=C8VZ44_DESAS|nr:hydantoinase/oxoprolinase family protein [Desulfofarcimen acetoxidans]ACV62954.1 Hydantoinase/oxoprolinase [Desulfofarcimen acetoxidans DSM 771]
MLIGIDVGGTCTDAVLLHEGRVLAKAKIPTAEDLLDSLMKALDQIMAGIEPDKIERVVFSTTKITNLIAERKYDPVAVLLLPGPGVSCWLYDLPAETVIVNGAIDYRGREIIKLDLQQAVKKLDKLAEKGYRKLAIVGKFSNRNNSHESEIEVVLKDKYPDWQVVLGHRAGGRLNFPRRAVNTFYTCATRDKYREFINSVSQALKNRGVKAKAYILKADGGTLSLEESEKTPVETIFSGPAASTLGVQALIPTGKTAIVMDIGGTTTDLALILSGEPLLSAKGAKVEQLLTQVRGLAVKSIPVGGDTTVEAAGDKLTLTGRREGAPYCLGGPSPTPTDALLVLNLIKLGDRDLALEAMNRLGLKLTPEQTAGLVVDEVVKTITAEIRKMFREWEEEPAYRIWEILQKQAVRLDLVAGVGGGAAGLVERVAAELNCFSLLPHHAEVANAIGAAVACPTVSASLRADTERQIFTIDEAGYQGKLNKRNFSEQDALQLAREWLARLSETSLAGETRVVEITRQEVFNVVRGWHTVGKIYDIVVQTKRGILSRVEQEETI